MLIFDQLRKSDRRLQLLSVVVLAGMAILLSGLWYVQVISRKKYEDSLKIQSFRTVPVPAVRGKILDRKGLLLADNEPHFNVNVFLEDLPRLFNFEYTNSVRKEFLQLSGAIKLDRTNVTLLREEARYRVVSNIVANVSWMVGYPLTLDPKAFAQHYANQLALPLKIFPSGLTPRQLALFMEKGTDVPGVDLDVQPIRTYPHANVAAHLLGYLRPDTANPDDEDFQFSYPLPSFAGKSGLEGRFDEQLRGKVGIKSILVNNIGYRQREEIWTPAQAGENLYLTLDLAIQKAADEALPMLGPDRRGAAVVVDVRNGDILAASSYPSYDPNLFMGRISDEVWAKLNDPEMHPQLNRAFYGIYPPGSVFKIIVSLAGLEEGLDPHEVFDSPGYYRLGKLTIHDTAGAGKFDFRRAFLKSSNPYFITQGLKIGPAKLFEMGRKFHLGEYTGVLTNQELRGYFPAIGQTTKREGGRWQDGDTANLSIGQGEIAVTPLQVALMTAAIANRGKLFYPRLVSRVAPQEPGEEGVQVEFPPGEMHDQIKVSERTWDLIHDAMLADVEDPEGSGRLAFVQGMRVCGKTGTAQVQAHSKNYVTWFTSFAPFESPRYAVVVMAEHGASGGISCAPIARDIYKAIQRQEQLPRNRPNLAVKD